MTRYTTIIVLIAVLTVSVAADTFKNRQTGETFNGFVTQKQNKGKTLVYMENEKTFKGLSLSEYEITRNDKGRRNSVVIIPIKTHEIIISKTASKMVAKTIIDASNKGPKCIILEIDNPGGTGEYMKEICSAITQTKNCLVVAYISGGKYAGAYSAACGVAFACDKIYMAGDAVMGSLGPVVTSRGSTMTTDEYNSLFGLANLSSYSTYVAAIAKNNHRPPVLAKAFLDKSIEIVEFEDQDGNRRFAAKDDRTSQESIIRTVSQSETRMVPSGKRDGSLREVTHMVVSLTADEAARARLVDKVVTSRNEILVDLGIPDAQIMVARGVENTVRKFISNQRNIKKELVKVDYLQEQVDILSVQLSSLEEQIRTNPATVQQQRYSGSRNSRNQFNRSYPQTRRQVVQSRGTRNRFGSGRQRGENLIQRQSVTTTQAPEGAIALVRNLAFTSNNLVRSYRRVIGLSKRDEGALPAGRTLQTLQIQLDRLLALQSNLVNKYGYYL